MHITPQTALAALTPSGKLFQELYRHGSLSIEVYKPQGVDLQQPHDRDELYVVIAGKGEFYNEGKTVPIGPGDVLFVAEGAAHRFLNFSDDFSTWVFFYGPIGREK